jgi:hypothetical protein
LRCARTPRRVTVDDALAAGQASVGSGVVGGGGIPVECQPRRPRSSTRDTLASQLGTPSGKALAIL